MDDHHLVRDDQNGNTAVEEEARKCDPFAGGGRCSAAPPLLAVSDLHFSSSFTLSLGKKGSAV